MSTTNRPDRETAYRLFAAEFDDASLSYAESDEERAPNYVVTPTGARVNRLFAVGVLTEIEVVNDSQLRARVVDPTGAFVVYAGQYQPEALSFLESATPPAFVAVTGKARTFQPEDSDRVFTSVRPETLSEVDAETRDRFVVGTTERTLERVETVRDALARAERDDDLRSVLEGDGIDVSLAAGVPRAIAHYGTTSEYLDAVEEMAREAAAVVAGDREEVTPLTVEPGAGPMDSPDRTTVEDADESAADEPATGEPSSIDSATTADDSGSQVEADEGTTMGDDEPPVENGSAEPKPESSPEPIAGSASTAGGDDSVEESTAESETPTPETDLGESVAEDETVGTPDPSESVESEGIDVETDLSGETESGGEPTVEADLENPEEFELDDEVREQVEAEFGTEFESAATVDDPGEADIGTPTPDDEPDESAATAAASETEGIDTESASSDENTEIEEPSETEASADVADADVADEPEDAGSGTADADPEEAVVVAMQELDDGDGANREAVVERVGEEYGLTPAEASDGIQAALMSGACYEPDDETLKAI